MSPQAFDTIVASPSNLVRESLAALLRARCGARVATSRSAAEALAGFPAARVLVCDTSAMDTLAVASFIEQAHRARPGLSVIRIDDSADAKALQEAVVTVCGHRPAGTLPHESLTPLEAEVMLAVATGLRTVDVARRMRRSSKTIEKHRANAMRKLGIRNVAQLTAYAIRHCLLDGDSILAARPD